MDFQMKKDIFKLMNDNVYSKIIKKKKKKNARLVNNAKKCKVYKIEFLG